MVGSIRERFSQSSRKFTKSGGSSMIFSSAFCAAAFIACARSIR